MRWFALALLSLAPLAAADFSGIWVGTIPGRNGDPLDIAFQFVQKGEALTGKLYGDYAGSPIVEGKVSGYEVNFVVVTSEQAGNQINTTRLRFTGCFSGGKLRLTREREQSTNAGNSGGVETRANSIGFTLRRLL